MFAALQGRAWGGGRARGIPGVFLLTIRTLQVTLPTWPPPLHPRRKGLPHRSPGTPPGGAPQPGHAAARGPFPFLPATRLQSRETNVRRANQLQKRGPERSETRTRDPRQPAAASRPGLPARRQPPPDLGVPSPRSQAGRRHPAAGSLAALRPARGEAPCHPEAGREEPGAEQPLG